MEINTIIYIIIDTLRKDYDYLLDNHLQNLSFKKYNNVISPAPWTIPTHASIFTGLYPIFHKAHETKEKKDYKIRLSKKLPLLTEIIKNNGYESFLISANPFIRTDFGFKGFDEFIDISYIPHIQILKNIDKEKIEQYRRKDKVNKNKEIMLLLFIKKEYNLLLKCILDNFLNNAIKYYGLIFYHWPKEKGSKKILQICKKIIMRKIKQKRFIFINFMEVHEPYSVNDTLGSKGFQENLKGGILDQVLLNKWKHKYPKEIQYVLDNILDLITLLNKSNIYDDSLIVITSDHGQLLGEHNRVKHGVFLYDELLHVPLYIKYPKDYNIEIMTHEQKYITLNNTLPFILDIIKKNVDTDSSLYSDTVFAESYGIQLKIKQISNEEEQRNIHNLEKYRIAVYHKSFKGIFNVEEWVFEELISYNTSEQITEEIRKEMKHKVVMFLRKATVPNMEKKLPI